MECLWLVILLQIYYASCSIRSSLMLNKIAAVPRVHSTPSRSSLSTAPRPTHLAKMRPKVLLDKVRPVGENVVNRFLPLTELPPPHISHIKSMGSARRHMDLPEECTKRPPGREVYGGPKVDIVGDYYDDKVAKTIATVIFPDHIDHKHFQVTTQVPYLTLGPIEAIGYHPSTMKSEHPSECEKIYQDHLDEQYSEESKQYSEESLEMARMPLFLQDLPKAVGTSMENMYEEYQ